MSALLNVVGGLLAALDAPVPPHLAAVVDGLERGPWPEVADRWSRLTPSGFPVEITTGPGLDEPRWTAEIAGPKVVDADRLGRVAAYVAAHGVRVDPALLAALAAAQTGRPLRFGAWLGGRETPGRLPRLKLYAELRTGTGLATLGLPAELTGPCRWLPPGSEARMLGVELARCRMEGYVRLPIGAPFLHVTGHEAAWSALREGPAGRARPGGRTPARRESGVLRERAAGRRAVRVGPDAHPVRPELLAGLVPGTAGLDAERWRVGSVTLGLDPAGRALPAVVVLCPHRTRTCRAEDTRTDEVRSA